MSSRDQRLHHRFKVAIRAFVGDPHTDARYPCVIRDGSISGCQITCASLSELPDRILFDVPAISRPICGSIVWREENTAGVKFHWDAMPDDERRKAPRQEIYLPCTILDHDFNHLDDSVICDASRSGCRIVTEKIAQIPDDIYVEIFGLTEPMIARIVWRSEGMGGVQFLWESDIYELKESVPEEKLETEPDGEDEKAIWKV